MKDGVPGDDIELLCDIGTENGEELVAAVEENVRSGYDLRLRIFLSNHRDHLPGHLNVLLGHDALDLVVATIVGFAPNCVIVDTTLEMTHDQAHVLREILNLFIGREPRPSKSMNRSYSGGISFSEKSQEMGGSVSVRDV